MVKLGRIINVIGDNDGQLRRQNGIWGGADIYVFVFTYRKNNWLKKDRITQNTNIWILPPHPISYLSLGAIDDGKEIEPAHWNLDTIFTFS